MPQQPAELTRAGALQDSRSSHRTRSSSEPGEVVTKPARRGSIDALAAKQQPSDSSSLEDDRYALRPVHVCMSLLLPPSQFPIEDTIHHYGKL
jgi:hypothetical protein